MQAAPNCERKGFMSALVANALSSLTSIGHPYASHPTTIAGAYRSTLDKQKRRSTRAGRKALLRHQKRTTRARFLHMLKSLGVKAVDSGILHVRRRSLGYFSYPKNPRFKTVAVRDSEHRQQLLNSMTPAQIRSIKRKTGHARYTHILSRSAI